MYFGIGIGIGIGIGWKVSVSVSKFGIANSLSIQYSPATYNYWAHIIHCSVIEYNTTD